MAAPRGDSSGGRGIPIERHQHKHDSPESLDYNRAFALGVMLNAGFVLAEAVLGWVAQSLALVADAGHNLSDVLALLLAWGAASLSQRTPSAGRTYGWRRSSILAPLANAVVLLMVTGGVAWEALQRIAHPTTVDGGIVTLVAAVGVGVNTGAALLFVRGKDRDLNWRGAFLHLAADAAVSVGVVLTGIGILVTHQPWLDPAVSLVVCAVILWGTWGFLKDALNLAMDAVPRGIDTVALRGYLMGLPGVLEVHDLHVWGMSATHVALTVHVVVQELTDTNPLLATMNRELRDRYGIDHVTIQIEAGDPTYYCALAPVETV
ncbi:MAG: cobalt transporter [Candidatus Handelsmanbacteria bacterium RIFCSPLOWO2_12_FULL_64_10]|uniref:Cobalt transporter n=1 Tax=Handelsmanbacteria sp. (strain RIFCSPLOWO2_12_FULL_64_10) TaxID=1817868 RepID=A0A1F6CC10_HANXR|nr:MAG: cobalt transporter [Candidatus Handelsmanbacteria bacterium RIFCSPLOWO2_12_FULL_64_10]